MTTRISRLSVSGQHTTFWQSTCTSLSQTCPFKRPSNTCLLICVPCVQRNNNKTQKWSGWRCNRKQGWVWLPNLAEQTDHRSANTIYEKLTSVTVAFIIIINQRFLVQFCQVQRWCLTGAGSQNDLNVAGTLHHFKVLCKLHHCSGSSKAVEALGSLVAIKGVCLGLPHATTYTHWLY